MSLESPPVTAFPSAQPVVARQSPVPTHTLFGSRWRTTLIVLGAIAALLWIGLWAFAPVDRDEARFALASRGMAYGHDWTDWVIPRVDGELRLNKPPLIYWCQALSARAAQTICGTAAARPLITAYRIPSALAATGAALLTLYLGRRMFRGVTGLVAGLLLAASAVELFDARQARADQVLLFWTVLAQVALWHIWRSPHKSWGYPVLFWLAVALGVLTKGPITPVVSGLTIVTLCILERDVRWVGRLRLLTGVALCVALVTPWVLLAARAVGWQTLWENVHREIVTRGTQAQEGHTGPPGYYVALLAATFWPGSLALVPAAVFAWRRGLTWHRPTSAVPVQAARFTWLPRTGRAAETFCLAWFLPSWIVFELAATKLPHYVLPLYPALALLCARVVVGGVRHWRFLFDAAFGWVAMIGWYVVAEGIVLGLPLLIIATLDFQAGSVVWIATVALLALAQAALVASAVALLGRRRPRAALNWSIVAAILFAPLMFQCVLPHAQSLWLSPRLVAALNDLDPERCRPVASPGYQEPSFLFLTPDRDVEFIAWSESLPWLAAHPDGLIVRRVRLFEQELPTRTLRTLDGFNYSRGQSTQLRIDAPVNPSTTPPASAAPPAGSDGSAVESTASPDAAAPAAQR